MEDPFRFSAVSPEQQIAALEAIIRAEPVVMAVLGGIQELDLPDGLLASGAIYNTVWNRLTGRPLLTGIKDFDVAYFDDTDLSYQAEDRVITQAQRTFYGLPLPVEVRNQARVHLWFPQKFGTPYPQLRSSAEMMLYFASKTHAVAACLERDGAMTLLAPYGLSDLFSFRITPNRVLDNRKTHETKAARAAAIWPEITVEPW